MKELRDTDFRTGSGNGSEPAPISIVHAGLNRLSANPGEKYGPVPPNFPEIVSGVILFAAKEGDRFPVGMIHCVLRKIMPHEQILSGLRFSLTGDVCYSSFVDRAIRNLVDWRSIRIVENATAVVERVDSFRMHLSRCLSISQLNAVHSASMRYHDWLRREMRALSEQAQSAACP